MRILAFVRRSLVLILSLIPGVLRAQTTPAAAAEIRAARLAQNAVLATRHMDSCIVLDR